MPTQLEKELALLQAQEAVVDANQALAILQYEQRKEQIAARKATVTASIDAIA